MIMSIFDWFIFRLFDENTDACRDISLVNIWYLYYLKETCIVILILLNFNYGNVERSSYSKKCMGDTFEKIIWNCREHNGHHNFGIFIYVFSSFSYAFDVIYGFSITFVWKIMKWSCFCRFLLLFSNKLYPIKGQSIFSVT